MRKGNLEFTESSYLCDPPEHIGYSIVKWEPNNYYGRESEFIKDGEVYHPNNEHYKFISIHQSCFKSPETSYVVASWYWNNYEDCYDLSFVGDRPLNLTSEEWVTFKELLEYGFKQINPWWYENSSDR